MKQPPPRTPPWISYSLWAGCAYFILCGVSALLAPQLWLLLAGLPTALSTELILAFGVAGTYLLSLGFAAALAAINPHRQLGIIVTLGAANLLDLVATARAILLGQLPVLSGAVFCGVAALWCALVVGIMITLSDQQRRTFR